MTNDPRAQSRPKIDSVKRLREIATIYNMPVDGEALLAAATELERLRAESVEKDAEIARLIAGISELGRKGLLAIGAEQKIIAECRARGRVSSRAEL